MGTKRLKNYFFQITETAVRRGWRFRIGDRPNQAIHEDLIESSLFSSEIGDRAKEDTGASPETLAGHVVVATDVQAKAKQVQKLDRTITVQPSQLPDTVESTNIALQSGLDSYTGKLLNVVDDPLVETRSSYLITVVAALTTFLNTVFAKIEVNKEGISNNLQTLGGHNARILANKQAIDAINGGPVIGITPIGGTMDYFGDSAPGGWVLLKGYIELDKTTYADLYAVVGNVNGFPNNNDNFVVWKEEFDDRVVQGAGSEDRLVIGGVKDANLQVNEMSPHTHGVGGYTLNTKGGHTHKHTTWGGAAPSSFIIGATSVAIELPADPIPDQTGLTTEGDHKHTITGVSGGVSGLTTQAPLSKMQPYIVMNKILYHGVV